MSPTELIEQWKFRVHRVQRAHYESARRFERMHLWLGLPAIALSTIVGTAFFASRSRTADFSIQIAVGLLRVAAVVLTALQTFLKNSELSERHRLAGVRFASIKHRIEPLEILPPATEDELRQTLVSIEESWAKFREESPTLPTRVWRELESKVTFEQTRESVLSGSQRGAI
jgi:hypothetical protein